MNDSEDKLTRAYAVCGRTLGEKLTYEERCSHTVRNLTKDRQNSTKRDASVKYDPRGLG